ncbi:MAG: hypothetical protein U0746_19685 [Gemmataceae bacterium]
MTHLSIDRQPEAVKRFFESLTRTPGVSGLAMNGTRITIRVVPDGEPEWTPAKNERRLALIDRKIARQATPDELLELELLQEELHDHIEKVAPLPLDYARRLHRELLAKAAANGQP